MKKSCDYVSGELKLNQKLITIKVLKINSN